MPLFSYCTCNGTGGGVATSATGFEAGAGEVDGESVCVRIRAYEHVYVHSVRDMQDLGLQLGLEQLAGHLRVFVYAHISTYTRSSDWGT